MATEGPTPAGSTGSRPGPPPDTRAPDASPGDTGVRDTRVRRRTVLGGGLAAGAAAVLGTSGVARAVRGRPSTPDVRPRRPLRQPDSLPAPDRLPGTDLLPQIDHIVVLMMENHSYDNILGMLGRGPGQRPRGDGFTLGPGGLPLASNPYADGRVQHAFRMPTTCQLTGRPSQEWAASHVQYANGRNDGFVVSASGPVAMGYWTGEDLPFTYSLASTFPVGDRWFCSLLGQTDPNRRFLIAGTSAGMVDDIGTSSGNAISDAALLSPAPNGTIFDRLSAFGIPWIDYYATFPTGVTAFLYPEEDSVGATHAKPVANFFTDAAAGNLPGFCIVDPNYSTSSQEDPQNIVIGEQFMAKAIEAVLHGPAWERTLLIYTYDEHGGYYDHVVPPVALAPDDIPPLPPPGESSYDGFTRYGFRVPAVVVSPYARRDHVTHVLHDHTSVLAMVERKWNLPAMTRRDANAHDLSDFLDFSTMAFREPPTLAAPNTSPAALVCSRTGPGAIPPPGSVSPAPPSGHHENAREATPDARRPAGSPLTSGAPVDPAAPSAARGAVPRTSLAAALRAQARAGASGTRGSAQVGPFSIHGDHRAG